MSWQQLWQYYIASSAYIQKDILDQLNLENLLRGLDAKGQIGVMKGAPDEIFKLMDDCLLLNTKVAFRYNPWRTK